MEQICRKELVLAFLIGGFLIIKAHVSASRVISAACTGATIAGECGPTELLKLTKYIQGSNNSTNCNTNNEGDCRDGDSDAIHFYEDFLGKNKLIHSFHGEVPEFSTKCKNMRTKYMSLAYQCIPGDQIMRLCENKTIRANEIHILNMDYPNDTFYINEANDMIKSPCHCRVDSTTSKHAVITIIRATGLGDSYLAIQGESKQCRVNIKYNNESNIGYDVYKGSLPIQLVHSYGNNLGYYHMWFMIKSDDGGNITLSCGETKDTLDETLPKVCKVSSNTIITSPNVTNISVITTEGSPLLEDRGVSTTTAFNATSVYGNDITTGIDQLNNDESIDTEQLDLGLVIGCVLAVVVVCLIVLVLVMCYVQRHKKKNTNKNNSDDENTKLDSKQHGHPTKTPTHPHNEYSAQDATDTVEEGHDNYTYIDTDELRTRLPPDGMSDDDGGYAGIQIQPTKLCAAYKNLNVTTDADTVKKKEEIISEDGAPNKPIFPIKRPDLRIERPSHNVYTDVHIVQKPSVESSQEKVAAVESPVIPDKAWGDQNYSDITLSNNIYTSVQKPQVSPKTSIEKQAKEATDDCPVVPGKVWGDQNYSDITLNNDSLASKDNVNGSSNMMTLK